MDLLNIESDELDGLSLSGIIANIMTPLNAQPRNQDTTVQVDPNTIQGQNQAITFCLQDESLLLNTATNVMNTQQHREAINMSPIATIEHPKPYIKIIEEPASHKLRFRYPCEGRGAGSLLGENSTPEKKTFPKIRICGYQGPAIVVVSCVTHNSAQPKAHPHNLVSPASVSSNLSQSPGTYIYLQPGWSRWLQERCLHSECL